MISHQNKFSKISFSKFLLISYFCSNCFFTEKFCRLTGSLLNSPKLKPDWKYLSNETMSQLSHEASEFIRHSVQSNPQDRTTVKEALRHQWFQNRHCKDTKTKFATSFEEFNDLKNKIQSIVSQSHFEPCVSSPP